MCSSVVGLYFARAHSTSMVEAVELVLRLVLCVDEEELRPKTALLKYMLRSQKAARGFAM